MDVDIDLPDVNYQHNFTSNRLKENNEMMGHRASGAAAMFKSTANKGSYRNSPKVQPRGGKSMK